MHSNIERELKHKVVYTPDQIYTIIMYAKVSGEKYNVKEMMQTEFYNIKELINNKNWIKDQEGHKILWTQIMKVSVSHSQPSILKFKYDFYAEYSELNTEPVRRIIRTSKRGTRKLASPSPIPSHVLELHVLYTEPLPISKALHDNLMSLCKLGDIPNFYHAFYESLTHASSCSESTDDDTEDN